MIDKQNKLATKDCIMYKEGNIIVIMDMMPKPHCRFINEYPIGLITEITDWKLCRHPHFQLIGLRDTEVIKVRFLSRLRFKIKLDKYRQPIRLATKREIFLYHLEGGPLILENV